MPTLAGGGGGGVLCADGCELVPTLLGSCVPLPPCWLLGVVVLAVVPLVFFWLLLLLFLEVLVSLPVLPALQSASPLPLSTLDVEAALPTLRADARRPLLFRRPLPCFLLPCVAGLSAWLTASAGWDELSCVRGFCVAAGDASPFPCVEVFGLVLLILVVLLLVLLLALLLLLVLLLLLLVWLLLVLVVLLLLAPFFIMPARLRRDERMMPAEFERERGWEGEPPCRPWPGAATVVVLVVVVVVVVVVAGAAAVVVAVGLVPVLEFVRLCGGLDPTLRNALVGDIEELLWATAWGSTGDEDAAFGDGDEEEADAAAIAAVDFVNMCELRPGSSPSLLKPLSLLRSPRPPSPPSLASSSPSSSNSDRVSRAV